jgi:hypothetical protein
VKLLDLNPRWFAEEGRSGQGITFDCPGACCAGLPSFMDWNPGDGRYKHQAGVVFTNPIDGGPIMHGHASGWQRIGDTFEILTLSPSVLISPPDHFHGRVENGEVTPV